MRTVRSCADARVGAKGARAATHAAKKTTTVEKKRLTKAQVIGSISDKTGLAKKDVTAVFTTMQELIKKELGSRGPGEFVVPDLLKLKVKKIPARAKRKGIDPFTKEERVFPAKPASKKVRATPLKKLKDLV